MVEPPRQYALPESFGQPATRALTNAGFVRLDQLAGASATALLALHGVGPKAIRLIQEALAKSGLPPLSK